MTTLSALGVLVALAALTPAANAVAVALWGQCGGKSGVCPAGITCTDVAWGTCTGDAKCVRFNEWYWQCQPAVSAYKPAWPSSQPLTLPFPPTISLAIPQSPALPLSHSHPHAHRHLAHRQDHPLLGLLQAQLLLARQGGICG